MTAAFASSTCTPPPAPLVQFACQSSLKDGNSRIHFDHTADTAFSVATSAASHAPLDVPASTLTATPRSGPPLAYSLQVGESRHMFFNVRNLFGNKAHPKRGRQTSITSSDPLSSLETGPDPHPLYPKQDPGLLMGKMGHIEQTLDTSIDVFALESDTEDDESRPLLRTQSSFDDNSFIDNNINIDIPVTSAVDIAPRPTRLSKGLPRYAFSLNAVSVNIILPKHNADPTYYQPSDNEDDNRPLLVGSSVDCDGLARREGTINPSQSYPHAQLWSRDHLQYRDIPLSVDHSRLILPSPETSTRWDQISSVDSTYIDMDTESVDLSQEQCLQQPHTGHRRSATLGSSHGCTAKRVSFSEYNESFTYEDWAKRLELHRLERSLRGPFYTCRCFLHKVMRYFRNMIRTCGMRELDELRS